MELLLLKFQRPLQIHLRLVNLPISLVATANVVEGQANQLVHIVIKLEVEKHDND